MNQSELHPDRKYIWQMMYDETAELGYFIVEWPSYWDEQLVKLQKNLKKLWAWRRLKPRRALPYVWIIKPCNSFQVYFLYVRGTNRTPIWPPPRWFDSLDGISVSWAIRHNGLESPSSPDFFQNYIKGQFNCRDLSWYQPEINPIPIFDSFFWYSVQKKRVKRG